MNKGIIFLSGLIVGGILGSISSRSYFKKKYETIAEKEISEMEDYYGRTDEYARSKKSETNVIDDGNPLNIRPKDRKKEEAIDYGKFYKKEQIDTEEDPDEEMNQWHRQNFSQSPTIITEEEAGDLPNWVDQRTLYYYSDDNILTDDESVVIDEPRLVIGTVLENEDPFKGSRIIYVMNYAHDTCYEIQKFEGDYDD